MKESKKIKVCFVGFASYPLFNKEKGAVYTGAEVQLYLIAKSLLTLPNYEVSFLVGDYGQESLEEHDGIKVYKYPYKLQDTMFLRHLSDQKKVSRFLDKIGADIYIHRSGTKIAPIICHYAKKNNKKFVYMLAHNINAELSYPKFAKKYVTKLYSSFGIYRYLYALLNADYIIVQNNYQKHLLEWALKIKPILIRSGYDIADVLVKKGKHILYVSRCTNYKQPEVFIELAKSFPKESFVMISPGDDGYLVKIKDMAQKVSNLKFLEQVHLKDIDKYFLDSKIFVNTSLHEGFPNTYIQAAKNKTPILTLHINPDEILNRYEIGFVCNDFDTLRSKISILLNDVKLYNRLSDNSYRYAKENHDIKEIIRSYDSIFRSLVKS